MTVDLVVGTGSYLVKIPLKRLISNLSLMQGLKFKCSYLVMKMQYNWCHGYYRENSCDKKIFEE